MKSRISKSTPSEDPNDDVVEIHGFTVKVGWWLAIRLRVSGKTFKEIAEEVGVHEVRVRQWAGEEWWKGIMKAMYEQSQADWHGRLTSLDEDILEGVRKVAKSDDHRTAYARVALLGKRLEAGEKALIKSDTNVNIDASQKVINITPASLEEVKKLTLEQQIQYARTGLLPSGKEEE